MSKKRCYPSELLMRVAYMKSQGWIHRVIADIENTSIAQVSRILDEARKEGYLEGHPSFNESKCTPEQLETLNKLDDRDRLGTALQTVGIQSKVPVSCLVKRVHVQPDFTSEKSRKSRKSKTSKGEMAERLASFARFVAPELIQHLAASEFCGVTWGYTLATVFKELCRQDPAPLRPHGGRKFVATCGEPCLQEPGSASSSRIALSGNELQGGTKRNLYTMTGAPAFIPHGAPRDVILHYIQRYTAYGRNFGKDETTRDGTIIGKLDTVITSVGTLKGERSTFHGELVKASKLSSEELARVSYGDVGGASLERRGLDENERSMFQRLVQTWIGIRPDDLRSVVKRAAQPRKKRPGVVVVTIGAAKARVVFEAVTRGLVSELFVDQELACALEELCKHPPADWLSEVKVTTPLGTP